LWIADKQGFLKDEGITVAFHDGQRKIKSRRSSSRARLGEHPRAGDGVRRSERIAAHRGRQRRPLAPFFDHGAADKDARAIARSELRRDFADEGTTHVIPQIAKAAGLTSADYTMTAVGSAPTRWKLLKRERLTLGYSRFR